MHEEELPTITSSSLKTLPGTRCIHSIIPTGSGMMVQNLSCFCTSCQTGHFTECSNVDFTGVWTKIELTHYILVRWKVPGRFTWPYIHPTSAEIARYQAASLVTTRNRNPVLHEVLPTNLVAEILSVTLNTIGTVNIATQIDSGYHLSIERHNEQVAKNRSILQKVFNCVKYRGFHEIALRDHDESQAS